MQTLKSFIRENKIKMDLEYVEENPWMDNSASSMNNYQVTLKCNRHRLTTFFSTGFGWTKDPSAEDVLDTLASDAASIENAHDFEDWCDEFGYDTDSRKAERTYRICKQQAGKLNKFLGDDLYKELLWEVEKA